MDPLANAMSVAGADPSGIPMWLQLLQRHAAFGAPSPRGMIENMPNFDPRAPAKIGPIPNDVPSLRGGMEPVSAQQPDAPAPPDGGGGSGGGLGASLFPAPEAENFLDPGALKRIRSLALLQAGAKLLEGSKGPQGTLNFGRSLGAALDQQPFEDMLSRLMQQKQWERQFEGYDIVKRAFADHRGAPDEDPQDRIARITDIATTLMQTGNPTAMQIGQQLATTGETLKRALPDTERVENVPGQKGGQYEGQNVVQIRDKRSGRVINEYPYKQNLDPQQRLTGQLTFTNDFDQHMGPLNNAYGAWQGYQGLSGRTDIGAARQKQQLAQMILSAGKSTGAIDASMGGLEDQILAILGRDPRSLSPEAIQSLDAAMAKVVPVIRQHAADVHRARMRIIQNSPELGLDPSDYPNQWETPAPSASRPKAPAKRGSATQIIEE